MNFVQMRKKGVSVETSESEMRVASLTNLAIKKIA